MLDSYEAHGRVRPVEGDKIGVTFGETELCLTPAEWADLARRILAACGAYAGDDAPNWTIDPDDFEPAPDEVISAVFVKDDDDGSMNYLTAPLTDDEKVKIKSMVKRLVSGDDESANAPDTVPVPTAAKLGEMRRVHSRSTPGHWNWWTSNSMRRLSTEADGRDGGVMRAYKAIDGVPDISVSEQDMAFIEMAHDLWPYLIDAVEALTAEREALRTALIGVVNATDGCASPYVSTEFLCHAPAEVAALKRQRDEAKSTIARLTAELRELRMQAIADFGQIQNATPVLVVAAPTDDAPLAVALERLKEVIGPEGRANVTAYLAEREAEYWDGSDWYGAYRRRVEEERAATFDAGKEGVK